MGIVFDHRVPRPLKRLRPGHDVSHTRDVGWEDLENGALATLAPFFEAALAAPATHRFVSIAAHGSLTLPAPR